MLLLANQLAHSAANNLLAWVLEPCFKGCIDKTIAFVCPDIANQTRYVIGDLAQQFFLAAQLIFGPLAFGDVIEEQGHPAALRPTKAKGVHIEPAPHRF